MENYNNYAELIKPFFAPPAWIFGPVWTVLYLIIFMSFAYVGYRTWRGDIPLWLALVFLANLAFNFLFTPLQFGLKNNFLASVDIILVLGTLGLALWYVYPRIPWVALINIPYLLWVSFATVLQLTITYLNWK